MCTTVDTQVRTETLEQIVLHEETFSLSQDPVREQGLGLQQVSIDDILEAQRLRQEARELEKRRREQILRARGMRPPDHTEDAFS